MQTWAPCLHPFRMAAAQCVWSAWHLPTSRSTLVSPHASPVRPAPARNSGYPNCAPRGSLQTPPQPGSSGTHPGAAAAAQPPPPPPAHTTAPAPITPAYPHTPHPRPWPPLVSETAPTTDARERSLPGPENAPPSPAPAWLAPAATTTRPGAHSAPHSAPPPAGPAGTPAAARHSPRLPETAALSPVALAPVQRRKRTLPGAGWRPPPCRSDARQPGRWGRRDDARAWG